MISWAATIILALVVTRIVWIEIKGGRRSKSALASTNEQIEFIKQRATARYRAKYGKDPTEQFRTVDLHKPVAKRS